MAFLQYEGLSIDSPYFFLFFELFKDDLFDVGSCEPEDIEQLLCRAGIAELIIHADTSDGHGTLG